MSEHTTTTNATTATTTTTTTNPSPASLRQSGVSYTGSYHAAPAAGNGWGRDEGRPRAGRLATIGVLVVALVCSGVTRYVANRFHNQHSPTGRRTIESRTSLAGMDSYALALLLGGLRGPLVMVLWAQSETQKADRNLEGIDTQIEWIRRLQPEFDTVHVFQMWNKAYNISVQMVGLANKYTTILDALDYGKNIDAERPDNLNLLKEIARVYAEKLGGSNPEKYYYRERIRRETRHRELPQGAAQRGEPGFQRISHDVVLDPAGNLLSQYLRPRVPSAERGGGGGPEAYDGSDFQFLARYQPFPYGVSPHALGYNYYKRAQLLMDTQRQKPMQVSEQVVDSQPGLALKGWAEEEWERGRRMEIRAFGLALPAERIDQERPTAGLPLDAKPNDAAVLPELIHAYDMASRVAGDSLAEYERHLSRPEYATRRATYGSHMDQLRGIAAMTAGDRDYLRAMQAPADSPERKTLLAAASTSYRAAIREFGLTALRYFTPDAFTSRVFPPGVNRGNIGTGGPGSLTAVTDEDVARMMAGVRAQVTLAGGPNMDENAEDRVEYETYLGRAMARLENIEAGLGAGPRQ